MWRCLILVFVAIVAIAGCNSPALPESDGFGRFEGDVVAHWGDDGRLMTLRETFTYIDPINRKWVAPAGTTVDGASIPAAFWSIIGSPFAGKYRNASVVHDVGCDEMSQPWEDVHRMFYDACRCAGVDANQAKVMYYAVYHFGPRWEPIVDTVVEPRDNGAGQVVMQEVARSRVARIDPPPPSAEEVAQVEAYVLEENPRPEAMERFNRDDLRRRGRGAGDPREGGRSEGEPRSKASHGRLPAATRRPASAAASAVPVDQQDYAIAQVQRHIERQTGETRPARYTVQSTRGAYRVSVQFVQQDDQGQIVSDADGFSTVVVSPQGQILESINHP
jgi:hypothetical protein